MQILKKLAIDKTPPVIPSVASAPLRSLLSRMLVIDPSERAPIRTVVKELGELRAAARSMGLRSGSGDPVEFLQGIRSSCET